MAVANVATTVLQPDEKREPDVGEAEQEQEKPTVEETEAGGDPEPHGSPLGRARRERKKVEPLTIDAPKMHTSSTKVVVGKGTRLRDIPNGMCCDDGVYV